MKRTIISLGLFFFVSMICVAQNHGRLYTILFTNNTDSIKKNINHENINVMFSNGYTPLMLAIKNK